VADYRILQLQKSTRVDIYRDSRLSAEDVLGFGFAHVLLATGATWRSDGTGRTHHRAIEGLQHRPVYTPDDLMAGRLPQGEVLIFDDETFYMGGVLAELLVQKGCKVSLVTPFAVVSPWAQNTMEQGRIQARLLELGVTLLTNQRLQALDGEGALLACGYTERISRLATDAVVLVTERSPNEQLLLDLQANPAALHDAGIKTLRAIGDCHAPGIIASAVYHGHLAARELEESEEAIAFRRERIIVHS
jgi:dimethylamine/trimethylamine dehydrogenase